MRAVRAVGVLVLGWSLWAANPLVGTWKLNVEKSKYSPGPPPKSATITYEETAEGIKRTGETVDAEGKASSFTYTAMYDGKYNPVSGSDLYDQIAMRSVRGLVSEATLKKAGKIVAHVRRVISEDGKTMTLTINGTNAKGKKTRDIAVYDKQ